MPVHALSVGERFEQGDIAIKVLQPLNIVTYWDEDRKAYIAVCSELGKVEGKGMLSPDAVADYVLRMTRSQTALVETFLKVEPRREEKAVA